MLLRFRLHGTVYIVGRSKEDLDASVSFEHRRYVVNATFTGGSVIESDELPPHLRHVRTARTLEIVLDDASLPPASSPFLSDTRHTDLIILLREIVARIYRAIRYYGDAPEFPDIPRQRVLTLDDVRAELNWWSPEISTDGVDWKSIVEAPPKALLGFLSLLARAPSLLEIPGTASILKHLWPRVVEALEDGKDLPPPEVEFLVNAEEHLRKKNYRLAVIESIIGLEIVLADFLRNYLTVFSHLPKKRLDQFLAPELGLAARVSACLDLTLDKSYLKEIDFSRVLKAIEWRNRVVHRSGRLPEDVGGETVQQHVRAVMALVEMLAERRLNIAAEPELRTIKDSLGRLGVGVFPMIWLRRDHGVLMQISFLPGDDPRALEGTMRAIAQEAGELLRRRDPRFDPMKHLTIHFKQFGGRSLGRFREGALELTP